MEVSPQQATYSTHMPTPLRSRGLTSPRGSEVTQPGSRSVLVPATCQTLCGDPGPALGAVSFQGAYQTPECRGPWL